MPGVIQIWNPGSSWAAAAMLSSMAKASRAHLSIGRPIIGSRA
jgi:hypothetical protein